MFGRTILVVGNSSSFAIITGDPVGSFVSRISAIEAAPSCSVVGNDETRVKQINVEQNLTEKKM